VQQNLYIGWPLGGRGQDHVAKFVILNPVKYFCTK